MIQLFKIQNIFVSTIIVEENYKRTVSLDIACPKLLNLELRNINMDNFYLKSSFNLSSLELSDLQIDLKKLDELLGRKHPKLKEIILDSLDIINNPGNNNLEMLDKFNKITLLNLNIEVSFEKCS